jgi:hypothetical protein
MGSMRYRAHLDFCKNTINNTAIGDPALYARNDDNDDDNTQADDNDHSNTQATD